ncbi:MAG: heme-binding protein [Chloroflexi bacterium]|nr:heme-binding protein [Chloroflexota bacterium]
MYEEAVLGLEETRKAIQAMLDEALKQPDRPVAMAVVDGHGRLVEFARMDRCRLLPQQLAIKKAYTAAIMRSDTAAVAERFRSMGRSISEMGDPNMAAVQGGVAIQRASDGAFLGGIGVSGLAAEEDEALARIGVQALGV